VALQRLLASIVKDEIERLAKSKKRPRLTRDGDDVFFENGKVSISIASISAVSTQIHFAVNVNNKNTPVKTAALEDFGINAEGFAKSVLEKFSHEFQSINEATQKVKPLK
jgi:hypothetical protein